jgi:hypothetical protein
MSRKATPLNITEQPGIGMGYVVRNVKNKKLVRVSTTCQRDIEQRGSKVRALRAFSGDEPFFTAKIGSARTGITVLKFLCGVSHKKCRDTEGTYEWTGITLKQARKDKLEFSEPNYVVREEAAAAPAPKATKVKSKTKVVKTVKPKATKVRKTTNVKPATVDAAPATVTATVIDDAPAAPAAPVQSNEEFEAEIAADFAKDLKKIEDRKEEAAPTLAEVGATA